MKIERKIGFVPDSGRGSDRVSIVRYHNVNGIKKLKKQKKYCEAIQAAQLRIESILLKKINNFGTPPGISIKKMTFSQLIILAYKLNIISKKTEKILSENRDSLRNVRNKILHQPSYLLDASIFPDGRNENEIIHAIDIAINFLKIYDK